MSILCKLKWHKWWPTDDNSFNDVEIVYKTTFICSKCGKKGKTIFHKRIIKNQFKN